MSGSLGSLAGGVQAIGGAVGDIFAAQGSGIAAAQFGQAATIAGQNAQQATEAYKLQEVQTARQVYQTTGTDIAAAGANGGMLTGSAASVVKSNTMQGALANQIIGLQGRINVNSFLAQQQADEAQQQEAEQQQKAQEVGAIGGILGGALSIGKAIAGFL